MLMLAAVWVAVGCSGHRHTITDDHVEIYLTAPQAQSVTLVMSGDSFQQVEAVRTGFGTWKATLNRVQEFRYFFMVDGKVFLPDCPLKEKDDLGANNCIFSP